MRSAKRRIEAERTENAAIAMRFHATVRTGDVERLAGLLAPDVVACMSSEPDTTEAAAGRDAVAAHVALLDADRILSIEVARGLVQTVRLK